MLGDQHVTRELQEAFPTENAIMRSSGRTTLTDQLIEGIGPNSRELENCHLVRLVAKNVEFRKCSFKFSILERCYFRNCNFVECDFTGCQTLASNLRGSRFEGCNFAYAAFERTLVSTQVLRENCPPYENLQSELARSLRTNYQAIGDVDGVNFAIRVELNAAETHLFKAWRSKESYYRKQIKGWGRIHFFFKWLSFKALDTVWGNGESPVKLLRSVFGILLIMLPIHLYLEQVATLKGASEGIVLMPQVFLGIVLPSSYPSGYIALIFAGRLILFALFVSILTRRLSRR